MNLKQAGGTKNKARLFKISAVTGRTIAYACVQASYPFNLNFFLYYRLSKGVYRTFDHETMGLVK